MLQKVLDDLLPYDSVDDITGQNEAATTLAQSLLTDEISPERAVVGSIFEELGDEISPKDH